MKHANDNVPILISLNDVCKLTSLSRTMINRLRSEGRFPPAADLGERRMAFVRAEVIQWIESKIAARASLSQKAA